MAETKKTTLAEDLIKLQAALPVMPKDTSNPFFKSKYTSLDTITEIAFPIMTKHNFAWITQPSFNEAWEPTLKYSLIHSSGDKIEGEMKLLLNKQDPQGQGSAITYARRYAITSVLGIVSDEDDDGNAARKAVQEAKKPLIDEPAPEFASVEVDADIKKGLMAEIKDAAKAKGAKDMDEVKRIANTIAKTDDFTKLPPDALRILKSNIVKYPKSQIPNLLEKEPF